MSRSRQAVAFAAKLAAANAVALPPLHCRCLCRRCHALANLPPLLPSWLPPLCCCRASAAAVTFVSIIIIVAVIGADAAAAFG